MSLEPGYYAVPDPDDPAVTTCWRWAHGRGLRRWTGGATYGTPTQPSRRNPPNPRTLTARIVWHAWFKDILAAIHADPDTARDRFARITSCCHACGKKLTDPRSVALGIGPDCRKDAAA